MRLSITAYYILIVGCALCADPRSEMLQVGDHFYKAVALADRPVLESLLDANFTWTEFEGTTLTRTEFLRNLPKLAAKYEADGPGPKAFSYGDIGDLQFDLGRHHVLTVLVRRSEGWRIIVHQEVISLEVQPTVTPGAGKDCENPCKMIPYKPKNATEQQVAEAYSRLETAAMAHNSPVFATLVADEFVAASSNSNKLYDKRGRMDNFDHAKMSGVAPTPLVSAQMFEFGDAVLMRSEHVPDRGKPLHVTRVWVKRDGHWMETLSYQTSATHP